MRIIVADHHPETLSALKIMLATERGIDLVSVATTAQDLLAIANEDVPDVILVDRKLPGWRCGRGLMRL